MLGMYRAGAVCAGDFWNCFDRRIRTARGSTVCSHRSSFRPGARSNRSAYCRGAGQNHRDR